MKFGKKIIALATAVAFLGSSAQLQADEDCGYLGGCCYQECRTCPQVAPAVAFGAIALIAIIAVAVQSNHGHSHN